MIYSIFGVLVSMKAAKHESVLIHVLAFIMWPAVIVLYGIDKLANEWL